MRREALASDEIILTPRPAPAGTRSLSVFGQPSDDGLLSRTLLENAMLKAEIAILRDRCNELEAENQKLYESLHLGCDTSSVPPSKDWKGNCVPKGFDEAIDLDVGQAGDGNKETPISITSYLNGNADKGRRPGGQKNHAPAFMNVDNVQERPPVLHYPSKCACCPRICQCLEEGRLRKSSTSHGYDIEVIATHTEHILFEAAECMEDGNPVHGDFPDVVGSQFYGMNVQLHVFTWHHIFHGSYGRIGLAAKELLGLSLGAGTANAIIKRVSEKILASGFLDAIRFLILLLGTVLGVDETSARVCGRNAWVHTAVTADVTLLTAHWRRGYEGSVYAGVLQFFTQTVISDCWACYFNGEFKFRHAICDGHILRELVAAAYFRKQGWAIGMFDLLLEIFTAKKNAVERGENCLPKEYIDDIKKRYRQIVEDGFIENDGVSKGKTISLLERLKALEDAALAFAVDFSVDFTNNASEQSVRNLKVTLRVIGQFKTMIGLVDYCIIQSFVDTCRKQGRNPYDMMRILLSGGDVIEAVFGLDVASKIKPMIWLANAFEAGDINGIYATIANIQPSLTEELTAAASYGCFKVYNDPPPEKKNPSALPKDKMQAARLNNSFNNSNATDASSTYSPQNCTDNQLNKKKRNIRDGPLSA